MSWSISISGKKADVKESVEKQCNDNIGWGNMNAAQKALVHAAVEAAPGELLSGYVSGHNNTAGGGSLSMSITASNPT